MDNTTNPHAITVYQGQEQHFKGNGTPFNREPLWTSKYDKTSPLYVLTSKLNKVRNNAIKLSKDYLSTSSETILSEVNHLCLKKGPDGKQVVFCINNMSSNGDPYELSIGGFESDDKVIEVTSCKTATADGTGSVKMYMGQGEPKVYVTAAALKDTGLCPQTTEDGPREKKAKDNGAASMAVKGGVVAAAIFGWALLFAA